MGEIAVLAQDVIVTAVPARIFPGKAAKSDLAEYPHEIAPAIGAPSDAIASCADLEAPDRAGIPTRDAGAFRNIDAFIRTKRRIVLLDNRTSAPHASSFIGRTKSPACRTHPSRGTIPTKNNETNRNRPSQGETPP